MAAPLIAFNIRIALYNSICFAHGYTDVIEVGLKIDDKIKDGQATEILVFNEERYVLRDIQELYLPELNDYVKNPSIKKRRRKSKVVKLFNLYSLHH